MFTTLRSRAVASATVLALAAGGIAITATPAQAAGTAITDPALKTCVDNRIDFLGLGGLLTALGLGPVLALLTSLDCHTGADITDVSALSGATNLTTLNLDDNAILDLSALGDLGATVSAIGQVVTLPAAGAGAPVTIPFPIGTNGEAITPTVTGLVPAIIDPVAQTVTWLADGVGQLTWSLGTFTGTLLSTITMSAVTKPVITGNAKVGAVVTAESDAGATYQWSRGGTVIPGAQSASYSPVPADLGAALTVTAAKAGFRASASDPTPAVTAGSLDPAPVPTVAGTASVGSVLEAVPGAWAPGVSFGYQWKRGTHTIVGATAPTYTPAVADIGATFTVTVTGSLDGYSSRVRTSLPTGAIVARSVVAPPVDNGSAVPTTSSVVATTTTAGTAAADNASIATAAAASATHAAVTRQSAAASVLKKFARTTAPKIVGTPKSGNTLRATVTGWSKRATLHYQWRVNGKKIAKATAKSYRVTRAAAGKKITVSVTATLRGYVPIVKTSKAAAPTAK